MKKLLSCSRLCLLLLLSCLVLALSACQTSGPQKTLEETAKALNTKDSGAFLAQFDLDAFAANELANLSQSNSLLNFAGNLGSFLGLRSEFDELLNSAMNLKDQYTRTFTRTVASGELINQCRRAQTPDCPWDPAALGKAEIRQIGEEGAIARITTEANMTSWIALRKQGEHWRIVGKAVLEETATRFASSDTSLPGKTPAAPALPGVPPASPKAPADQGKAQTI